MKDRDLFDETLLRSALRLEAGERAPRLDAAAIALRAARRTRPETALGALRALAILGMAIVVEVALAYAALGLLGDIDITGILGAAIALGAWGITALAETGLPLVSPTVALAAFAGLLFATVYEYAIGRESIRVHAS